MHSLAVYTTMNEEKMKNSSIFVTISLWSLALVIDFSHSLEAKPTNLLHHDLVASIRVTFFFYKTYM